MNKHQEALNKLLKIAGESPNAYNIKVEYNVLQGLVDRATPKKYIMWNDFPKCPACFSFLVNDSNGGYYDCCQDCGQAIDWSKDE